VGRTAHDGGGLLGPKWERYGKTPFRKVERGNVFTLEPSTEDAGECGCLGIEEMVVATETGCRWLSDRQLTLPCLGGAA
jgi:Xaa-Pro aminopeptidase